MDQALMYPKQLRSWRFYAPGTEDTIYATGITEEHAIKSLAMIRSDTVIADGTLFEGEGGWLLRNKFSEQSMRFTRGQPV